MAQIHLGLKGLQVRTDEESIERAVGTIRGIVAVKADRIRQSVWIECEQNVDPDRIRRRIEDMVRELGFVVESVAS